MFTLVAGIRHRKHINSFRRLGRSWPRGLVCVTRKYGLTGSSGLIICTLYSSDKAAQTYSDTDPTKTRLSACGNELLSATAVGLNLDDDHLSCDS